MQYKDFKYVERVSVYKSKWKGPHFGIKHWEIWPWKIPFFRIPLNKVEKIKLLSLRVNIILFEKTLAKGLQCLRIISFYYLKANLHDKATKAKLLFKIKFGNLWKNYVKIKVIWFTETNTFI